MAKNLSIMISTGSLGVRQLRTVAVEVAAVGKPEKLYRRLSQLGATGGSVTKTLNEYVMEGKVAKKETLLGCIKELRRFQKLDHALEIMEWMEKRKMNFSHADHAIRLDLIAKTKGVSAAEDYFNSLLPSAKNQFTYGSLLNVYGKALMSEKAFEIFRKMDEHNFLCNSLPFNNLMTLHMRLGQPEKVPTIIQEMKERKISPCRYSYNIWLQSYGCLNDFEGLGRVLDEMKKDKRNFDWTTYSNLASIYVKAGLFEEVDSALKRLEALIGPHERREAYHFLISLYACISNLHEVKRVWKCMKSRFPIMANYGYIVMLQALAKLKDIEGLTECFREWESISRSYDIKLANIVIKAYLEQDMYKEAEVIFENARKRTNGPFFKAREIFMCFFLKIHQLDLALNHMKAIFSEDKENAWQPDERTVSAFFNYFQEKKDVDGVEKFFNILKRINCLDSNAYSLLLKTYLAAGKLAPEMHQRLEEDNIEITHELGNLLERVSPK